MIIYLFRLSGMISIVGFLNWIDIIIIVSVIFFSLERIGSSFILEILDLASFILAFVGSFTFYIFPAKFFETQFQLAHGLSLVLGFMSIWFTLEFIFYLVVRSQWTKISKIEFKYDKIIAIIPAFFRTIIFIAFILILTTTFPIQPKIKKDILDSKIGSLILNNAYQWEQPVKNVFGGISNESLTFLTIKPKTDERVNLGFQTNEFSVDTASEQRMFDLVNEERSKLGLKTLVLDHNLQFVARKHSEDMFQRGYFSHYSPEGKTVADRALAQKIEFSIIGENLAYAPDVEAAHKGLMNSEGHRANILSTDYGRLGVGVMDGGVYGRMFTQVFAD